MPSAMNKWCIPEGLDSFGSMAEFAIFSDRSSFDAVGGFGFDMYSARPVANITAGLFQLRGLFDTDESSGFVVAGGVTAIAFLKVFFA